MIKTNKDKLAEFLQIHLPKEITEKQLKDWFTKVQDNNYNFFPECEGTDLRECAAAAGIELVKKCDIELEIPIFHKRKKLTLEQKIKINNKKRKKMPKYIDKCDIIEVYINQKNTWRNTCKILKISSNRLQALCKEYDIHKPKTCIVKNLKELAIQHNLKYNTVCNRYYKGYRGTDLIKPLVKC